MMDEEHDRFSRRHGYGPPEVEIVIREDAPPELRQALAVISTEVGLSPTELRKVVCGVLRRLPDPNNWSNYPNVWDEVVSLIEGCPWYRVYDMVESIHKYLEDHWTHAREGSTVRFRDSLNEHFRETGVGWLVTSEGKVVTRGGDGFDVIVREGIQASKSGGRPTASNELQEALNDLSRRPEPDLNGAIHHAVAGLECVYRDVSGEEKATLGDLLKRYPQLVPKPLDIALTKLWGYASEVARHVKEGSATNREESELVVGLAATVITYLSRKNPKQ